MDNRYERQQMMDEIGDLGQDQLKAANVLVVGAGGLGCPALSYLVAAGVGHIVIADHDTVTLSNLNRQFLFGSEDVGKNKAITAKARLGQQNDEIVIDVVTDKVTESNVSDLLKGIDVVVDCVDNVTTRLLMNRSCIAMDIPLVEGGVEGFYGFATVVQRGYACLACMGYEEAPSRGPLPVIGVTAGTIGTIEASECIRILLGYQSSLLGHMLQYDGITHKMVKVPVKINTDCDHHKV